MTLRIVAAALGLMWAGAAYADEVTGIVSELLLPHVWP